MSIVTAAPPTEVTKRVPGVLRGTLGVTITGTPSRRAQPLISERLRGDRLAGNHRLKVRSPIDYGNPASIAWVRTGARQMMDLGHQIPPYPLHPGSSASFVGP